MNKSFLLLCALLSAFFAEAQKVRLEVDTVITETREDIASGEKELTHIIRLYVVLPSSSDRLTIVYGHHVHPLRIHAGQLFQMEDGEAIGANNHVSAQGDSSYVQRDSWVTIGKKSKKDNGQVYFLESPSQSWTRAFEEGNDLVIDDSFGGAWFTLPGDPGGIPDVHGRVLIGQFRIKGAFDAVVNVQVQQGNDRTPAEFNGLELHLQ